MRKSFKIRKAVLLTEGGRSPTGVSKTGRPPALAASESVISIRGQPLEYDSHAVSSVSSGFEDPHMSRTSGNCRTAPGHSCGCVPLYRYAKAFSGELFCGRYEAHCKERPKDERDLSFGCV